MADEESKSEGKKKSGMLKWIILVLLLLLLAGGGYFAYLNFFAKSDEPAAAESGQTGEEQAQEPAPKPGDSQVVTLPTFLVNLADPLGRRYLKMTLDVEVADSKMAEKLEKEMPKVRDAVILLLSSKSYSDLATLESKILLKEQLVERLNLVLGGSKVMRVYFTELVIQ